MGPRLEGLKGQADSLQDSPQGQRGVGTGQDQGVG